MSLSTFISPLKCQGIKTKLVGEIRRVAEVVPFERWVEPFCGSCVVALNIQPKKALLCDSNPHIIRFYQDVQSEVLTPALAKMFLTEEGDRLRHKGEDHYYEIRDRFNTRPNSLDFLFLNRSCFNGMIRFNRLGKFNVPYCRKDGRFSQSYVTKIVNQIKRVSKMISTNDWNFVVSDFRATLSALGEGDLVYADPPYLGRHVDYYNSWSDPDELDFTDLLKGLRGNFVLSTWHSNEFRTNSLIDRAWNNSSYNMITREHFYHVGPTEERRHPMIEALITNLPIEPAQVQPDGSAQIPLLRALV
jgi:DNA adenine methylase